MNFLFIRKHFVFSVKNSKSFLFYNCRINIPYLGMHFIDPIEEAFFKFWTHSLRFPFSVLIYAAFLKKHVIFVLENLDIVGWFGMVVSCSSLNSPFREIFLGYIFS